MDMKNDYPPEAARQEILEMIGLHVLRIKTELVEQNLPMALTQIRESIRGIKQNQNPIVLCLLMREDRGGGA